jgi:hypothetical protein
MKLLQIMGFLKLRSVEDSTAETAPRSILCIRKRVSEKVSQIARKNNENISKLQVDGRLSQVLVSDHRQVVHDTNIARSAR